MISIKLYLTFDFIKFLTKLDIWDPDIIRATNIDESEDYCLTLDNVLWRTDDSTGKNRPYVNDTEKLLIAFELIRLRETCIFIFRAFERIGVCVGIFFNGPFRYESATQKTTYQAGDISKAKQVSLSIKKKRGKKYGYIAKHDFYELWIYESFRSGINNQSITIMY